MEHAQDLLGSSQQSRYDVLTGQPQPARWNTCLWVAGPKPTLYTSVPLCPSALEGPKIFTLHVYLLNLGIFF